MAFERLWPSVPPVAFTANGSAQGLITITSTAGFKVKQEVILLHPTLGRAPFQVKKVISKTQLYLGAIGAAISDRADLTGFDTTTIIYANEQTQSKPTDKELAIAAYDQEPTVAYREVLVDQFGNYYDNNNPVPVNVVGGSTGGGGSSGGTATIVSPNSQVIQNIAAAATSEIPVILPLGTVQYMIKVRDGVSSMNLAFSPGQSGSNFIKVNRGSSFTSPLISSSTQFSLYFQCEKTATVELITWLNV